MKRVGMIILAIAVAAVATWLVLDRFAGPAPEPPTITDSRALDPLVRDAIEQTLAAVKKRPHDSGARVRLAQVYDANGVLDLAEIAYEQALAFSPGNPKLHYRLACLQAERSDLETALATISQAIRLDSNYAPMRWRQGFWLLDLGRLDEAEASFQAALAINSSQVAAQVGLSRVALARGTPQPAIAALGQLLRAGGDPALQPYLHQLLGSSLIAAGKPAEARGHLLLADGKQPQWTDPWTDDLASMRLNRASVIDEIVRWTRTGRADAAISRLHGLLQQPGQQDDPTLLNHLAQAHFEIGKLDQGISVLQRVLASHPDHYVSLINLSWAYGSKGDTNRAMEFATAAVQANPALPDGHLQLAQHLMTAHNLTQAADELELAIRAGANDEPTRVLHGQVLLELKRWNDASRVFTRALEANPNSASAMVGLALALAEQGALADAERLLLRANAINPKESNLKATAARVMALQKAATPR